MLVMELSHAAAAEAEALLRLCFAFHHAEAADILLYSSHAGLQESRKFQVAVVVLRKEGANSWMILSCDSRCAMVATQGCRPC
jgi:hypothetical protein